MIDTQNIVNKMIIAHYEDLDSTLFNIMAAGVSESEVRKYMVLTAPKLKVDHDGVSVTSFLGFKMPIIEAHKC